MKKLLRKLTGRKKAKKKSVKKKTRKPTKRKSTKRRGHKCSKCGKKFSSKKGLSIHSTKVH